MALHAFARKVAGALHCAVSPGRIATDSIWRTAHGMCLLPFCLPLCAAEPRTISIATTSTIPTPGTLRRISTVGLVLACSSKTFSIAESTAFNWDFSSFSISSFPSCPISPITGTNCRTEPPAEQPAHVRAWRIAAPAFRVAHRKSSVMAIAPTGSHRTRWLVVDSRIAIVRQSESSRCNAFSRLGL
jgi:hypothetical protein